MDRFFCDTFEADAEIALPDSEARHVRQVLRKTAGETIRLFDGRGRAADAVLTSVHKKAVLVRVGAVEATAAAKPTLTIAAAVPKADRFKWMVEKLTELGVGTLVPLKTERTVVEPGAAKLERMTQTVIAACKQSGRDDLMTVEPVTAFADVLSRAADRRLIADVGDVPEAGDGGGSTLVIVGPEGGWTDEERRAAADAGFESVSLGPHVLRTETAAIAGAARFA